MNTDISNHVPFVQSWYEGIKNPMDTNKRAQLYENTEHVVTILKSSNTSNVAELCNAFIQEFNQYGIVKSKHLTEWIIHHTLDAGSGELRGAYPSLHKLVQTIKSQFPIEHAGVLDDIDRESLQGIEKSKKGIETAVVEFLIQSQLNSKELLVMRTQSLQSKKIAETLLIDRLNTGQITFDDLGINKVKDLIAFFGKNCSKFYKLDLRNLTLQENDIKKISESCPNLHHLMLEDFPYDTDIDTSALFTELSYLLPFLTTLELFICLQIKDLKFLQGCSQLTNLKLLRCQNVVDISFLQHLPFLRNLYLSCNKIVDFSILKHISKLTRLNIICSPITDLSFLKDCPLLTHLNLTGCNQIIDLSFLDCHHLINLNLDNCIKITDLSFLKKNPFLTKLNLSSCRQINDFNFLRNCPSLSDLDLAFCDQINDFSFLDLCPSLKKVCLTGCKINQEQLQLLRKKGIEVEFFELQQYF